MKADECRDRYDPISGGWNGLAVVGKVSSVADDDEQPEAVRVLSYQLVSTLGNLGMQTHSRG